VSNSKGLIAVKNDLNIGVDGAKEVSLLSFANQSKDNNVSELEPTLSTGINNVLSISGNFMLYANVAVIT